jgi:1-phosphofructokinase family hexose kinase
MLLTVTPNPTIDRTLHVPVMQIGQVHRAVTVHMAAGGKGLNVTRVALSLAMPVLTTAPLAGHTGRLVAALAEAEGLPADWYWLGAGETRTSLLLNHDQADTTVINEPGPTLSGEDWPGLAAHIERLAEPAQAVIFAGSLPLGDNGPGYADLTRRLAARHKAVYIDTSLVALQAVLPQPDRLCLKINQAELAAGLGQALPDQAALLAAGQTLLERGAALVVVTLGPAGALAIAPEGCWQARSPAVDIVSTVGSGDSFLAGLAIARLQGRPVEAALAMAVACGTANTLTELPGRLDKAVVERLLAQVKCERIG